MEKIALLPGGFKPPHAGHYNMAIWLAQNTDAEKVIVKVGAKERDGITREISLQLWDLFLKNDPNYRKRHVIKPGISGLSQIRLGYAEGLKDTIKKSKIDIYYIENAGFYLEAKIFFGTIRAILKGLGV